ncbi:MAG: PaaI family thioesterase [Myxococcota bacterium]|jgi:acyl-coenzyme A thioesterase PaaI-like protein
MTTKHAFKRELLPAQEGVPMCFACGQKNVHGMKLRFWKEGPATVSTEFTPPEYMMGWGNVLHGGFSALILDEVMLWVPFSLLGLKAFVTKEITVSYKKPTFVGRKLFAYGHLVEDDGRKLKLKGEIRDAEGNVLSVGECTIVRVHEKHLQAAVG